MPASPEPPNTDPQRPDPARRRQLGAALGVLTGALGSPWWPGLAQAADALPSQARLPTRTARPVIRPPRLKAGDTVALFNASAAIFEREPYAVAAEVVQALGFQVREAPQLRARYGHFAGTAQQRAEDFNALIADPEVHGLLAITGGSGANRVLPLLDYAAMAAHPKVIAGFSDVTAVLNAVQARTGLVTFHAPVGVSDWNPYSVAQFRAVLMDAQAHTLRNPPATENTLVPRDQRIQTLRPGVARGRLLGGNLAVLSSIAGSAYFPNFDGAILFLEEVNEYIYRVDRMLSTLHLAGAFDRLAGVVIGAFTRCEPGSGFGTLTLDEVFDDWFGGLGVPVFRGAAFGHIKLKQTLPVGLEVEMDATAGTLRLLEPAVV